MNADHTLSRQGMTGKELLKLAYQAANHYANRHPTFPASRIDDLAQRCAETVLRRAVNYDPAKNTGFDPTKNPNSTPFKSWCWMVMGNACEDFVRRRDEGFAGRLGRDKPITVEVTDQPEAYADETAELHELFDEDLADERKQLWLRAAEIAGWPISEFVTISVDFQAREIVRRHEERMAA